MSDQINDGKVVIVSYLDSFLAKSMMTKLKEANVSSSFVHAQIKEIEEHLDTMELNGNTYLAFFPAVTEEDQENEDLGLIFMKLIRENGEELLSTLDSDEEAEMVYNAFMEELFEEEEEED